MKFNFKIRTYIVILLYLTFLEGCTSSRYTESKHAFIPNKEISIRALLSEKINNLFYSVKEPVLLFNENRSVALIKEGNRLRFSVNDNHLNLNIEGKLFEGRYFELKPQNADKSIHYKNKRYRGYLKFESDSNNIIVINRVSLEDYLKGVIPSEMPIRNSYFQALKAFAICARTYAYMKLKDEQSLFDVNIDTRDQVYGGMNAEHDLASKAVDETRNMILTYDGNPAKTFYHSCCGGYTANAKNVFGIDDAPYLDGVKDGDPPNCSIAPNFSWMEIYPEKVFITRLKNAGLISGNNYKLNNVKVESRFKSGRVDVLLITLSTGKGEIKKIKLIGNKIRKVIRTADNSGILKSTMFNISIKDNGQVVINGKGNGHGVGLCQWGAIHQSMEGKNYKEILSFYYPGTAIMELK